MYILRSLAKFIDKCYEDLKISKNQVTSSLKFKKHNENEPQN